MLTKTARVADKAPVSVISSDLVRKDELASTPQRRVSDYRAMGQGDLHPNELYS